MGGETGVRAARLMSGVMGGRYRVRKSVHSRRELRRIMKGAIRERRLTLQRWSDIVEIIIMGSRQYVRERSRVTVLLLRRLPVFDGGPKFVNRRLKSGCCSFLEELLRLLRDDERTAAFGSVCGDRVNTWRRRFDVRCTHHNLDTPALGRDDDVLLALPWWRQHDLPCRRVVRVGLVRRSLASGCWRKIADGGSRGVVGW